MKIPGVDERGFVDSLHTGIVFGVLMATSMLVVELWVRGRHRDAGGPADE